MVVAGSLEENPAVNLINAESRTGDSAETKFKALNFNMVVAGSLEENPAVNLINAESRTGDSAETKNFISIFQIYIFLPN